MFKKQHQTKTTINRNEAYKAETIEKKVQRIMNAKEPIRDGAPLIYTERKDGVQPSYNIKTDKIEVALDAMQAVSKSHIAKREEKTKIIKMDEPKDGGAETIQGTTTQ